MSIQSRTAFALLSFALSPVALAQAPTATSTESTSVTHQIRAGTVEAVNGNQVVVREADGIHEYTVPEGFKFEIDGRPAGVEELKPGMKVGALITDKVTTHDVTLTRIASGRVMQVAPGGIVVRDDATGQMQSYSFKDPNGNDLRFIRDGREVSLRNVKRGDQLSGTFVTVLPTTQTSQRSVVAKAVSPPSEPAPEPTAVAAAPRHLPKTASPLPLVGLLAALSAGIAFTLRAVRTAR